MSKETCVEGRVHFLAKACTQINSLTHTQTKTKQNKTVKLRGGANPKKAKAQTGILPLWEKQQV